MFYDRELELLIGVLKKLHIKTAVLSDADSLEKVLDKDFFVSIGRNDIVSSTISERFSEIEGNTIYKVSVFAGISYIFLILPEANSSMLFIGPYLKKGLSAEEVMEIEEENGISPNLHKYVFEYFSGLPVISENSSLFALFESFADKIWRGAKYNILDFEKELFLPLTQLVNIEKNENESEALLNISLMEKRYEFENELMRAVTEGQLHKEALFLSNFTTASFEKRLSDNIRNFKNYGIIMNTLLRKAAEAGGVHPVYLDRISSDFAQKIEQLDGVRSGTELMRKMFSDYCRLVRKHSMKDYSPIVQKTIIYVNSNLSSTLTLSSVSSAMKVSSGYLSTIFKKECKENLTDYIAKRRVKYASHLLETSHLQIQTVALHCGIMDSQYFSKVFKKYMGVTPKEYRENMKKKGT